MKRVLCAIDVSDEWLEPLWYADAIMRSHGGCVALLYVIPTFDRTEIPIGREEAIAHVKQAVAADGVPDDRVRYEAELGEPAKIILARAVALHADTIVLGTSSRRRVDRPLLGSVADMVLRRAPCDVLAVPPDGVATRPNVSASTIVCGIDFSPASIHALRATLGVADRMNARVVLVHVIEWLAEVEPLDEVDFNVADFRTRLVYKAQQRLDALIADEAPAGRSVRTKVAIGRSYRELLAVAAGQHADLIVVGHCGQGGAAGPLLGSTVEETVRAARCPVLTIRLPHEAVRHADHP